MILILNPQAKASEISEVKQRLDKLQVSYHLAYLYGKMAVGVEAQDIGPIAEAMQQVEAVQQVVPVSTPYKFASREWKKEDTAFEVKGELVGGNAITVIAGPCAVESEEQIFSAARVLSEQGVKFLRGGAYKPRTSPYSFQGLELEGLKLIRAAADEYDMRVVTEVIDFDVLDQVYQYTDVLQVGSRNMHNYYFLKELGKVDKPILLKRGMFARITEWLLSAEYILSHGNENVVLCERGIRSFDDMVRNVLDISAVPLVQELSHLPVFVDPSQGSGLRHLVEPMTLAAIAGGSDGVMIEVHPEPAQALSDGRQSVTFKQFSNIANKMVGVAEACGRSIMLSSARSLS